jgi:hypothetical protein
LIAASAIVSVVVSLRQNQVFDFDSLAEGKAALLERENTVAATDNASEPEAPAVEDTLPATAGQQ